MLTILAPCVLPLLPIVIGGSIDGTKNRWQPLVVTTSLALSLTVFTLLLRASTSLIGIPDEVWRYISGGLVIVLGALFVFPKAWEQFSAKAGLNTRSNILLGKSAQSKGMLRPVLIGASLGPVFTSCSPTYGFVLTRVFPESFFIGTLNIIAYVVGLSIVMLLVGYGGQKATGKLTWAADPHGWFRRGMGIVFVLVGMAVLSGFDKTIETAILDSGIYDPISNLEQRLR